MPIIGKPLLVLGSLAGASLAGIGGFFTASALDSQSTKQATLPEENPAASNVDSGTENQESAAGGEGNETAKSQDGDGRTQNPESSEDQVPGNSDSGSQKPESELSSDGESRSNTIEGGQAEAKGTDIIGSGTTTTLDQTLQTTQADTSKEGSERETVEIPAVPQPQAISQPDSATPSITPSITPEAKAAEEESTGGVSLGTASPEITTPGKSGTEPTEQESSPGEKDNSLGSEPGSGTSSHSSSGTNSISTNDSSGDGTVKESNSQDTGSSADVNNAQSQAVSVETGS